MEQSAVFFDEFDPLGSGGMLGHARLSEFPQGIHGEQRATEGSAHIGPGRQARLKLDKLAEDLPQNHLRTGNSHSLRRSRGQGGISHTPRGDGYHILLGAPEDRDSDRKPPACWGTNTMKALKRTQRRSGDETHRLLL